MKAGIETKLENVSIISTITPMTGFPTSNLLTNDTLTVWKIQDGTGSLVLQFDPVHVEAICLFNLHIENDVIITTYTAYPAGALDTVTIDVLDLCGFESKNALFEVGHPTAVIDGIKIDFNGSSDLFETYCGYIWAGDFIDFGCCEKIQPIDESTDEVTITRANAADSKDVLKKQSYNITIKKENNFEDLRDDIREVLTLGYGVPRPWIIDEPFLSAHEVMLGIMDSGKVKYDLFDTGGSFISNATIGIIEVF